MTIRKLAPWFAFVVFVAVALATGTDQRTFAFDGPLAAGKLAVWAAFAGFLAFSIVCSSHENIFRSIAKMSELWWGWQVGIDLYIGVALSLLLIWLNEGSLLVLLAWLLPMLLFANLATLLYVAIHYDAIVARFLS